MNKKIERLLKQFLRERAVAITVFILIIIAMTLSSFPVWAIWSICFLLSVFGASCFMIGGVSAWRPRKLHPGRTYKYFGSEDLKKDGPKILFLGVLVTGSIRHGGGYFEEDNEYVRGVYEVDDLSEDLVLGKDYYASVIVRDETNLIILRPVR